MLHASCGGAGAREAGRAGLTTACEAGRRRDGASPHELVRLQHGLIESVDEVAGLGDSGMGGEGASQVVDFPVDAS